MSCKNCKHLKIKNFTYRELTEKWDEIYGPEEITPGYYIKFLNAARKEHRSLERTRLKFLYCTKGVLTRFYIIRAHRNYQPKKAVGYCHAYA